MCRKTKSDISASFIPRTVLDIAYSPVHSPMESDESTTQVPDATILRRVSRHESRTNSTRRRDIQNLQSPDSLQTSSMTNSRVQFPDSESLEEYSSSCSHSDHDYLRPEMTRDLRVATDLHEAVTSGDEKEVRRVLSQGGPHLLQVYTRHTRSTPLHLAASLAHSHLVTPLIRAGCSVGSFDSDGNTPLHICCENGDSHTVSALLSASDRINPDGNTQALHAKNYDGMTCFLLAASTGNASLMTLLARAGCDVNSGDGLSGRTALHHAAAAGNTLLARFLLQTLKADVNRRDFGGNTALGLVEQHKRQDLALLLIRHGGEVRVLD